MTGQWRMFLAMLVLTIVAAGFAGWAGVQYGVQRSGQTADLDTLLHRDLHLDTDQDHKIHTLEQRYGDERTRLQAEMQAANRDLARAITTHHAYGPDAQRAIDRFHRAMGLLQEATVRHILAMRAILSPQQAQTFDGTIAKALGADAP